MDLGTAIVNGIAALGSVIAGYGSIHTRNQLKTINGHTVGQLIEQNLPPSFEDQAAILDPRGDQRLPGAGIPPSTQ